MTLDSGHASFLGEGHELILKMLISLCHHETYVHERTVFDSCCALEQWVAVDLCIKKGSLLLIDLLDCLYTSHFLEPSESFVHHVDGKYRRSIEH